MPIFAPYEKGKKKPAGSTPVLGMSRSRSEFHQTKQLVGKRIGSSQNCTHARRYNHSRLINHVSIHFKFVVPFIGRESQVTLLRAQLDEVVSQKCAKVVLLEGAYGTGKSMLWRHALAGSSVHIAEHTCRSVCSHTHTCMLLHTRSCGCS